MTRTTDKAQQIHEELQDGVRALVTSDDWTRALEVAARFHRYSFSNTMLILMQRPDATQVAGFNTWKKLGRHVLRGENGIKILAPMTARKTVTDEETGEEQTIRIIRGFKVVHVFDVSQTDGKPLPDVQAPELLTGEASAETWDRLVGFAGTLGYTVLRETHAAIPQANGVCDYQARTISVRPDLQGAQALKTLVHEIAHAVLHGVGSAERSTAEVEAESTAFVVLRALGHSPEGYSFPYVAGWSGGDLKVVQETGERVVDAARRILEAGGGLDSRPPRGRRRSCRGSRRPGRRPRSRPGPRRIRRRLR